MPGFLSGQVVCRDIEKLPESESELRAFFFDHLAPTLFSDFQMQTNMMRGVDFTATRDIDVEIADSLTNRGCEVSVEGGWTF